MVSVFVVCVYALFLFRDVCVCLWVVVYMCSFLLGLCVFSFDCRLSLLMLVGCLFVVCVPF